MGLTDKTASAAAYVTSAGAFGAGMTLNEAVAVTGLVLAVLTFLVNVTFKYLHYRLQKAAHDAEINAN